MLMEIKHRETAPDVVVIALSGRVMLVASRLCERIHFTRSARILHRPHGAGMKHMIRIAPRISSPATT
jgi:hypothetical protein